MFASEHQTQHLETYPRLSIQKADDIMLLGIVFNSKLSFNSHVENLVSKCNSHIFLMRKLKTIGLNAKFSMKLISDR